MRIRRVEFIAIIITFTFVVFMGGYFLGNRASVNIEAATLKNSGYPQQNAAETASALPVATQNSPTGGEVTGTPQESANQGVETTGSPQGGNVVSSSPAAGGAPGAPKGGDGRININTASASELTDLPGIGPVLAGRIIDFRTQNGAYTCIEDIKKVSGIGVKKFEAIADRITVG